MEGKVVDSPSGIRTVDFDNDKGFLLNGQPYSELKGTAITRTWLASARRCRMRSSIFACGELKRIRRQRCAPRNDPPTPESPGDACDHLGMIVMDESRLLGNDQENLPRSGKMRSGDRNHASVGIMSVANEEFSSGSPAAEAATRPHDAELPGSRLDLTRSVTYAAPEGVQRHQRRHRSARLELSRRQNASQYTVSRGQVIMASIRTSRKSVAPNKAAPPSARTALLLTRCAARLRQRLRCQCAELGEHRPGMVDRLRRTPWLSGGFVWTGFD